MTLRSVLHGQSPEIGRIFSYFDSMTSIGQLLPGTTFKRRYELVRCVRAGGMGAIYEVRDGVTRRRRALKTMLPSVVSDPDLRSRFAEEATVTANIESDHIVEVFDAGVDDETGLPFIVMEFLEGEDLGTVLERSGEFDAEAAVTLLRQAAFALDKTHAAGIVHRDLKPENLFLCRRDDGSPQLKLLDFGIAKVVAQGAAKTTRNIGTPLYMSPEQIRGDGTIDVRADVYALGHIAYALLVGRPYWQPEAENSDAIVTLFMHVVGGIKEAATVRAARRGVTLPVGFDAWFARAVASDALERFASATELVEELAGVCDVPLSHVSAVPPPAEQPVTEPRRQASRRAIGLALLGTVTGVLALALAGFLLTGGARDRPEPLRAASHPLGDESPARRASSAATTPSAPVVAGSAAIAPASSPSAASAAAAASPPSSAPPGSPRAPRSREPLPTMRHRPALAAANARMPSSEARSTAPAPPPSAAARPIQDPTDLR